jgi:hypothetical protein
MKNVLPAIPFLALLAGCLSAPTTLREGEPKVRPDENDWRRASAPIPPFYLDFTSGRGQRWTMVTPLYWQVRGPRIERQGESMDAEEHYHLLPLAGYARSRPEGISNGHVANYFWGKRPQGGYHVFFPLWWDFEGSGGRTTVAGPVYSRTGGGKERTVVFPWLYSREKIGTDYDYWGVCFRLIGLEKQVFAGEEKKRLWLFFVFKLPLA